MLNTSAWDVCALNIHFLEFCCNFVQKLFSAICVDFWGTSLEYPFFYCLSSSLFGMAKISAYLVNASVIVKAYFYPCQKFCMVQTRPCESDDLLNCIVASAVMDFWLLWHLIGLSLNFCIPSCPVGRSLCTAYRRSCHSSNGMQSKMNLFLRTAMLAKNFAFLYQSDVGTL
jgi:hypothetical protein